MYLKTVCKRLTALMLAVFMILTLLPVSVFAEDIESDMTLPAEIEIVSSDMTSAEAKHNDCSADTPGGMEVSDDASAVQEPETETDKDDNVLDIDLSGLDLKKTAGVFMVVGLVVAIILLSKKTDSRMRRR